MSDTFARRRRRILAQGGLAALNLLSVPGIGRQGSTPAFASPTDAGSPWNAFIAIVWPHEGQGNPTPVGQSRFVNVSVWPRNPVACGTNPTQASTTQFMLWRAKNNDVAGIVARQGKLVQRNVNGVVFPSVEFDDVPADLAGDSTAQYRFTIGSSVLGSGLAFYSNVWVHAVDARTYAPHAVVPTGFQTPTGPVDARIQFVWPHDGQVNYAPVSQATRVNVAFDLFAPGTLNSVHLDYEPYGFGLMLAKGNGAMRGVAFDRPTKRPYTVNDQTYPRWVFNNIPVTPGHQYHFAIWTNTGKPGGIGNTNLWTHAADARTYLPSPTVPYACTP